MGAFNPQLITDPRLYEANVPLTAPEPIEPVEMPLPPQVSPMPPQMPPAPIFVPPPMAQPVIKPAPRKALSVSPEVARKAQGIYPAEQQAKQNLIDNSKAPPAPTGAWGSPA